MLKYRLIFGPVMIGVLLAIFFLDNHLDQIALHGFWQRVFLGRDYLPAGLPMLLIFLMIIPLAAMELCRIFRAKQIEPDPFMVSLSGMVGCTLMYILPKDMGSQRTLAVFVSLMILLFLGTLVRYSWRARIDGAVAATAVTMFAMIYLGMLPGFLIAIRRWHSAWVVLAVIVITKCCDIGAYFVGRAIGRHKLIVWLSPGKTWEGLIGGMIFSGLVAALLAWVNNHYHIASAWATTNPATGLRGPVHRMYPIPATFVAGMLLGVVGQFGDLVASLFKRDAGIKDSGHSIPGFGGVLDVVDSPLVVAPLAYWLLEAAVRWS